MIAPRRSTSPHHHIVINIGINIITVIILAFMLSCYHAFILGLWGSSSINASCLRPRGQSRGGRQRETARGHGIDRG
jgi:hypothetical protein